MLSSTLFLSLFVSLAFALPRHRSLFEALAVSPYAPITTSCPDTPLIREANGISLLESSYIQQRQAKANAGLTAWLRKIDSDFPTDHLPIVGITTSGGGYRSLLTGAGVLQALDGRDGNTSLSGLYQGLTYQAGLSGGSWMLNSIAGNNWPTITSLKTSLWETTFDESLADPSGALFITADAAITADVEAKNAAGFNSTLTDPYGRLLSYQLLKGIDGGVSDTLHGLTAYSNFTSQSVPYPIITAIGVNTGAGQCTPGDNGTQYELHPYEFGSWDSGVSAFVQTPYLGTRVVNGSPSNGVCYTNYDNLGYILGSSSNLFNEVCLSDPSLSGIPSNLTTVLTTLLGSGHQAATRDEYAVYPNPFQDYPSASLVSNQTELSLVDGGESNQNNPIWPFLHRPNVSVLFVNDNSADTSDNYPNGSEIYNTYRIALSDGLTRMPVIPPSSTFISQGLNTKPTFFGCNTQDQLTIIYIPNYNYTYDSGVSTAKLQYTKAETDALIANGVAVGSYNGNTTFAECVGCAILKKTGASLPNDCTGCFSTFCFN